MHSMIILNNLEKLPWTILFKENNILNVLHACN